MKANTTSPADNPKDAAGDYGAATARRRIRQAAAQLANSNPAASAEPWHRSPTEVELATAAAVLVAADPEISASYDTAVEQWFDNSRYAQSSGSLRRLHRARRNLIQAVAVVEATKDRPATHTNALAGLDAQAALYVATIDTSPPDIERPNGWEHAAASGT